ncbi:hypothetical protein COY95_01500, partial [Candidatus Woesearchaeota archaeon CG_4_10_14_0_8_um_filter_47_5]
MNKRRGREIKELKEKYVESSDKTRIYYQLREGTSQEGFPEVLFFVHGIGGSVTGWDKVCSSIRNIGKTSFTLIFMDIRAHGFSEKPKDASSCSMKNVAEDVQAILDAETIKKVTLIGHSFGSLCLPFCYRLFPGRIKNLIFIGSNASVSKDVCVKSGGSILYALLYVMYLFPLTGMLFSGPGKHIDLSGVTYRHDFFSIGMYLRDVKQVGLCWYLPFMRQVLDHDETETIKKIDIPSLILHGDYDKIFLPSRAEEL